MDPTLDPIAERQKITRLDYRVKLCYKPHTNLPSTTVDLTGLIEHGIVSFAFDISNEGERYPRVKDAKLLLEGILEEINGDW